MSEKKNNSGGDGRSLVYLFPKDLLDNPRQVRTVKNPEAFATLKADILAAGVEVPVLAVRLPDGRVVIEEGHTRRDAVLEILGELPEGTQRPDLEKIPVLLADVHADYFDASPTAARSLVRQLILNISQTTLHPLDRLRAVKELKKVLGITKGKELIKKLKDDYDLRLSPSMLSNINSLAKRPDLVAKVAAGLLTYTEARNQACKKKKPQGGTGNGEVEEKPNKTKARKGHRKGARNLRGTSGHGKNGQAGEVLFEQADDKTGVRLVIYGPKHTPRVNYRPLVRNVWKEVEQEEAR